MRPTGAPAGPALVVLEPQRGCKFTLKSCSVTESIRFGMALHPRRLLPVLRRRLATRPITVLTGARQTGKTTLVRDLLPAVSDQPVAYFSLDDPDERLRLAVDPVRRLDHGERLVILDEVQKQPGLLDAVKLLADRSPMPAARSTSSSMPPTACSPSKSRPATRPTASPPAPSPKCSRPSPCAELRATPVWAGGIPVRRRVGYVA